MLENLSKKLKESDPLIYISFKIGSNQLLDKFFFLPVAERTAGKGMRVDTLLLALDGRVDSHRMTDGATVQTDSAFGAQETDFCRRFRLTITKMRLELEHGRGLHVINHSRDDEVGLMVGRLFHVVTGVSRQLRPTKLRS